MCNVGCILFQVTDQKSVMLSIHKKPRQPVIQELPQHHISCLSSDQSGCEAGVQRHPPIHPSCPPSLTIHPAPLHCLFSHCSALPLFLSHIHLCMTRSITTPSSHMPPSLLICLHPYLNCHSSLYLPPSTFPPPLSFLKMS